MMVNLILLSLSLVLPRPIDRVVIHHTAGNETSVQQIRKGHKDRGFRDIAYHYVVFPNGKVETGRDVWKQGAGVWGKGKGFIEVVMVGELHKNRPTQKQFISATQLAAKFCISHHLPYWRVSGHKEVAVQGHGTLCPGLEMRTFRLQVEREMNVLKVK